jgi:5-oxoprolinase (ATP-hydrolysing)
VSGSGGWQIWIDTGGTFTDALGLDPEGELHRAKILSTGALRGTVIQRTDGARLRVAERWHAPADLVVGFRFRLLDRAHPDRTVRRYGPASASAPASVLELSEPLPDDVPPGTAFEVISEEEAPVLAARLLTRTPPGRDFPVASLRLATTLGTNALLERRGAPTALFVTRGFGDLLRIGTQQRPDLFALDVRRPEPLYVAVVEVTERLAADGSVLVPLDESRVAAEAERLAAGGVRSAAVALMHSYRDPRHEIRLRDLLTRCGFEQVSCSSDLAPFIKILPRAETAVVDAYLAPVVGGYLARVRGRMGGGRLHVMTSAGGLVGPETARPKDTLLSGPAGGVVGAALAGRRCGLDRIIAFDMGGTSTDVARCDGDFEYVYEHQVGEAHLVAPALAIESVAAGGGSVCWFDGHRLRVGPRSAGATPGPACYGAGGPLTLTDVNLLLGRLDPGRFEIPIVPGRAESELEALRAALRRGTGEDPEPETVLAGLLEIANERMAEAIRRISLRRGYDPAEYALVAFGGAGGQHACAVASGLGIVTVLVPPDTGLLSALGLGHAVIERFAEEQVLQPLARAEADLAARFAALARRAERAVQAEGVPESEITIRRRLAHLRFAGQDATVEVPYDGRAPLLQGFQDRYAALFGHRPEGRAVELEAIRVVASSRPAVTDAPTAPDQVVASPFDAPPAGTRRACVDGTWSELPLFDRDRLAPGALLRGPALVFEAHSATVIEPGWRGEVDRSGTLVLRHGGGAERGGTPGRTIGDPAPAADQAVPRPEAVRLELFTNRLRAIATDMGERLRQTAISTNIRERLDFSCAILDRDGELVVNAPHIPVHLGALGLCVRGLRGTIDLRPGDVVATNHPAYGGSHLPDVTVVTPVFADDGALLGYVASRAHHAEIGGSRPGSMPPAATRLAEEGVVIPPLHLIEEGRPAWAQVEGLLRESPFPSRAVADNLADLRAAVAANHAGAEALRALARTGGAEAVARQMEALKRLAERHVREALAEVPDGRYEATEALDDGSPLRVAVAIEGDAARVDFTGSAQVHSGNLNATPAVVRSVLIYVLRLLVRRPLPLNEGLLRAVAIDIPRGILNPDFPDDPALAPAIVGGNIETSQRLVDTLLKALRLAACSQGTMNNVLFGDAGFGYYETIGGGCGAGQGFDGASAVHSHMTNTRITDTETLEHRFPVRVERFAIRRGSGGAGRFHGGDGAVREITFLAPLSLSVLSQHRTVRPYGLEGGEPGLAGSQRIVRQGGDVQALASIDGCEVGPGDRLVIETPGGGGYGQGNAGTRG